MKGPALWTEKGLKLKSARQLVQILQTLNTAEKENIFDEFFDKKQRKEISEALNKLEKILSKKVADVAEQDRSAAAVNELHTLARRNIVTGGEYA